LTARCSNSLRGTPLDRGARTRHGRLWHGDRDRSAHAKKLPYNLGVHSLQTDSWLTVATAFGLLELTLQLLVIAACPFRPIGDEKEYIERGRSGDPHRFALFHRLPVLPAIARLVAATGRPVVGLRLVSAVSSSIAVAAIAAASTLTGGPVVATVLCVALLLIPERIFLGSRIWPDILLAAATSCIAAVLSLSQTSIGPSTSAGLTGCLVAFAVLVRLDALVLIPAAAVAWAATHDWSDPDLLVYVVAPPVVAFAWWWVVSITRFGEHWPDTTWKFNLGITMQDALAPRTGAPIFVDDLIERHRDRISDHSRTGARPAAAWSDHARSIGSRLRAVVGPDTFVTGKLLTAENFSRCRVSERFRAALLRRAFPLLLAVAAVLWFWRPTAAVWSTLPALSFLFPAGLFLARSRYRLPVLYGLVPVVAGSLAEILYEDRALSIPAAVGALVLIAGICHLLSIRPNRLERL